MRLMWFQWTGAKCLSKLSSTCRPCQHRQFIKRAIRTGLGEDVGFPARTQETSRCIVGHPARVPAIHGPQRVDRVARNVSIAASKGATADAAPK